jgi:clan AA aspartic protease
MIRGIVSARREATIQVSLRGPSGRVLHVEAAIDTGFDRYLTLPPRVIAQLRLPWVRSSEITLGDGSDRLVEVYRATVLWDGRTLAVPVEEVDAEPVVGMALLEGFELKMEVRSGGKVTIKRLPRRRSA